jgi:enediyne biosynthesis protein E4
MKPLIHLRKSAVAACALLVSAVFYMQTVFGQQGASGWFTDVAPRSNFSYKTDNDYTGRKYFPQPMCGGVAVFDYDNDGLMDIFLTNGAQLPETQKTGNGYDNALLRNKGDGIFEDVTAKAGLAGKETGFAFGVAAGDYDNDGHEDLFVASGGRNTLYHNNGNGTFTDVTTASGLDRKPANLLSVGAAWFDFDNDGLLDLIVSNYTLWDSRTDHPCYRVADDRGLDETAKNIETYCSPKDFASASMTLYRNLGHGRFEDVTEASGIGSAKGKGMGISIADFNSDGLMDIFIANDTERNLLFINQGGGKFKDQALLYGVAYNEQGYAVSGMGSDAKDYNNDGLPDIVYNDLAGQVFGLFRNDRGRQFDDVARESGVERLSKPYAGWSMGFIDFDNDGFKDIYSANGDVDNIGLNAKQHDTMFRNLDGEHFADDTAEMGSDFMSIGYQRGAAFGDLNNDGYLDIVVTSLGQKPRILMNRASSGNHWLLFDLRGTESNHDGIGAQIKVRTPSGRTLYNHATTSVGFMSSSDRRVHFGLDKETSALDVEIRWPSAIVQKLGPTKADQIVKVVEPGRGAKANPQR